MKKLACPISPYISNAFIHVSDLKLSTEWYSRLLSLPIKPERQNGGPIYNFDLANGTDLILDDNRFNQADEKHPAFMLHTKDTKAALEYIQALHLPVVKDLYQDPMVSFFSFADPFGNVLMVCGPGTNESTKQSHEAKPKSLMPVEEIPIQPLISNIFVNVTHLPQAIEWYSQLLQLPIKPDDGSGIYEIKLAKGANIILDVNRHLREENFQVQFMFNTADIRLAKQHIEEHKITIFTDIEEYADIAFFTFEDPDKNILMVCQEKK